MGATFECIKAIIWKWVFLVCRVWCSLVHHTFVFSKWLRNERVMDETLTTCFFDLRSDDTR